MTVQVSPFAAFFSAAGAAFAAASVPAAALLPPAAAVSAAAAAAVCAAVVWAAEASVLFPQLLRIIAADSISAATFIHLFLTSVPPVSPCSLSCSLMYQCILPPLLRAPV